MSGFLYPYGKVALVPVPAVIVDDTDFAGTGDYTPAAADVEFSQGPLQPYATLTVRKLAFTSGGTSEIVAGDTIDDDDSGASAIVALVELTSGSWAAGTAAGNLWVYNQSGSFDAGEIDINGGAADQATIAGDSVAGHLLNTDTGDWFAILTPTEMAFGKVQGHSCFGRLNLIDAALENNAVYIGTIGSSNATYPRIDHFQATYLIPTSIDLASTATVRIGMQLMSQNGALPEMAEITPGTISIERKAIGDTSWSAIETDVAMSEAEGLVYFDEEFNGAAGYAEGDSIRITFKSVSIVVGDDTFEIVGVGGVMFQTEVRQTMRGTDSAALASALATVDGNVDAIKAVTDNLPDSGALTALAADVAAILLDTGTTLDGKVDAIQAVTDALPDAGALTTITANIAAILADTDELQSDDIPASLATIAGYLDTEIATIVSGVAENQVDLDAVLALVSATALRSALGLATANLDTQLAALPTAVEIRTEVDSNSTQFAALVAALAVVDGIVDTILLDTNELQTDWANGGRLDLLIDSLVAASVTASGEPGQSSPPVSASRGVKIDYLYQWARNRSVQTESAWTGYENDGTTAAQTRNITEPVSGTTELSEMTTGS